MIQDIEKELELNRNISVFISDDNMSAYVKLAVPSDKSVEYTYEDIRQAIDNKGVKMGIDEGKIYSILQEKRYNSSELIASGKEAEDGTDGEYTFFFNTDNLGKPMIREDGSVDYHNMRLFELVRAGDKLVEYTPPTSGVYGYDVRGKLLIPKSGKPKSPMRGRGFTVSEDGTTYYAEIDGKVEYRNYDLNVRNVLTIPGDVDLSTGNIEFNGDIDIRGSVISGMSVCARGSISINGHVEAAIIKADKNICFKNGVNGKCLARVEAGGDVSGRFFENVSINCKGNLTANYLLNCNVVAYGKVIVSGKQSSVQGGDVTGVLGVQTGNAGVENGVTTVIRAGAVKSIKNEYAAAIKAIKDVNIEIDMLDTIMEKYSLLNITGSEKYDHEMYNKVMQSKIIKMSEKTKYNEEAKYLCDLINAGEHSQVKVYKNIFPGTKVFVNGVSYMPDSTYGSLIIRQINGKLTVSGMMEFD